ncbi:putative quinol monooxygenase [Micromonospora sp. SL4-19]|uniref:putative quinol monooxygenase n=1 Tax=Micromonospora sp. SL4-19 TaxID=3399129 RepID=UPI003A4D26E7
MFTVVVHLEVRPDRLEEFLTGIETNARASLRDEPGCLRFDVHRIADAPNRFLLYEIYRNAAAFHQEHRSAPHYAQWQQVVARCVQPGGRTNTYAIPVFPADIPESQQG